MAKSSIAERLAELKKTKGREPSSVQATMDIPSGPQPRPGVDAMKTKEEGQALISTLAPECNTLQVVDEESYQAADEILGKIQRARKAWNLKMYGSPAKPGPIPLARATVDSLYELNREIDKPLGALETKTKAAMKGYKLEEQRIIQAAKDEQDRQTQALRDEADRKLQAEEAAKTAPMRERLAATRQALLNKAAEVETAPPPVEAVRGHNSEARKAKKPAIHDMTAFLIGLAEDVIPLDVFEVKLPAIARHYKLDPEAVSKWPGVVMEDDIIISGR